MNAPRMAGQAPLCRWCRARRAEPLCDPCLEETGLTLPEARAAARVLEALDESDLATDRRAHVASMVAGLLVTRGGSR